MTDPDELRALADVLQGRRNLVSMETTTLGDLALYDAERMAAAAALRACADRLEADGWRPIETAPRQVPLLFGNSKRRGMLEEVGIINALGETVKLHGQDPLQFSPTHWRPLPEPPKDAT